MTETVDVVTLGLPYLYALLSTQIFTGSASKRSSFTTCFGLREIKLWEINSCSLCDGVMIEPVEG